MKTHINLPYLLLTVMLLISMENVFGQTDTNLDFSFIDSVRTSIDEIDQDIIKIKDGYYVISAQGIAGNIGVYVGNNGVVVVDNQWSELVPRIKKMIGSITDKPIRFIINTHIHFDHIDGNKSFGNDNIPIVAHNNVRDRLKNDIEISGTDFGRIVQKSYPQNALPTVTFEDSLNLFLGKEKIRLMHFPNAHTDGDVIVHFRNADIYHLGDVFVTYGIPVVDEANGGDIYAMINTIEYLLSKSNSETRFIPGHGPVSSKKELTEYRNLLTSIKDQVISLVKKGVSFESIIEEVKINDNVAGISREIFIPHVYNMVLKHENLENY